MSCPQEQELCFRYLKNILDDALLDFFFFMGIIISNHDLVNHD